MRKKLDLSFEVKNGCVEVYDAADKLFMTFHPVGDSKDWMQWIPEEVLPYAVMQNAVLIHLKYSDSILKLPAK